MVVCWALLGALGARVPVRPHADALRGMSPTAREKHLAMLEAAVFAWQKWNSIVATEAGHAYLCCMARGRAANADLAAAGAALEAKAEQGGGTPLHIAAFYGHASAIEALAAAGATWASRAMAAQEAAEQALGEEGLEWLAAGRRSARPPCTCANLKVFAFCGMFSSAPGVIPRLSP